MMTIFKSCLTVVTAVFASSFASVSANAYSSGPPVLEKPAAAKAKEPDAGRSSKSKECSAKADAQNLHGTARKAFRKECMKAS